MPREFGSTWQRRLRFLIALCVVLALPVLANCGEARTLRDVLFEPNKVEAVFFTTLSDPSRKEAAIQIPPLAAGFISPKNQSDEPAPLPVVLRTVLTNDAEETVTGVWHPQNRSSECRLALPAGFIRKSNVGWLPAGSRPVPRA